MKVTGYLVLGLFALFVSRLSAQDFNKDFKTTYRSLKNPNDSMLGNGFYLVDYYCNFHASLEKEDFRIENTQHVKDIELDTPSFIAKKKVKFHFIYTTTFVRNLTFKFTRLHQQWGDNVWFLINPIPIATKANIMRLYDFKKYISDSTICSPGLTIKLDSCQESLIYFFKDDSNKSSKIGLVINNELIAVTWDYFKTDSAYGPKNKVRYLSFVFGKPYAENIETYKRILFKQSFVKQ